MTTEWEKVKLGDLCEITSSKRFHLSERATQGIPFYCTKEIVQKLRGEEKIDCDYIDEKFYLQIKEKFGVPVTDDLLLTTRGTIGFPYLYKSSDRFYFADGNLSWFRNFSKKLDSHFLYYWFLSVEGKAGVDSIAKGTAQKAVPITGLGTLKISLPPLETQQKIAGILSTYDDLIENNRKQIKLLEEAAQKLYKEWFVKLNFPGHENTKIVDGVPEGWKKEKVGNLIKTLSKTKQIKTGEMLANGTIPVIDQSRNFIAGYTNDEETIINENKPVIVFGDHTRVLKLIQFPFARGADGTQVFVSSNQNIGEYYLYCALIEVDLSNYSYARHFKYLKEEEILIPPKSISEKFEYIANNSFKMIQTLRNKIQLLQSARDKILPKLMNGAFDA